MKRNFIGESLSVTMLSGLSIPISRMPLLEKSLITQIPLLVMDCDKPVGLLKKLYINTPASSFAALA